MNHTELQDALRAAVRAKRGAQAELARRLGISTPSVAAYITGGNRIPGDHIDVILDIIGGDISLQGPPRTGPLTPQNLTLTDPIIAGSAAMNPDSQIQPMTATSLAEYVLKPIPEHFPDDVRHYLVEGCECIAYAGFRHTLMAVGAARLALAAEAGVRAYAARHGVSAGKGHQSMAGLVHALHAASHLNATQRDLWMHWTRLRNELQHPNGGATASIGIVLPLLGNLHRSFLELFPPPEGNCIKSED